jgi:hypothetical protein
MALANMCRGRERDLFKIKRFPVATVTAVVALLMTTDALAIWRSVLTQNEAAWVSLGLTVLGIILGKAAHNSVTPLADPKNAEGVPLVPDVPAKPTYGAGR